MLTHSVKRAMPVSMKSLIVTLFLLITISVSHSAERRWNITLDSKASINNVALRDVRNDSLVVMTDTGRICIPVNAVTRIDETARSVKARRGGVGIFAGGLIGAGAGLLTGKVVASTGPPGSHGLPPDEHLATYGAAGAGLGILIGGIMSLHKNQVSYDLQEVPTADRLRFLEEVVKNQANPPSTTDLRRKIAHAAPKDTAAAAIAPPQASGNTSFFRIYGGVASPFGDFADASPGHAEAGGAKTGININGEYCLPVSDKFDVVGGVGVTNNSVEPTVIGYAAQYNPDISAWWNIWPMVGAQFRPHTSTGTEFYGIAQLGMLFGKSPEVNVTVRGVPFHQASESASTLAYRIGMGVYLEHQLLIDLRCMGASPDYNITVTGGGQSVTQRSTQWTGILSMNVGWEF